MSDSNVVHSIRKTLSRLSTWPPFSLVASLILSRKYRRLVRIWRKKGLWYHYCPDWVLVDSRIITSSRAQIDAIVFDEWQYAYRVRPGDVVLDVGAGAGWETQLFSRLVGPKGRVIAIEAHPQTFRCLQAMLEKNHLENVVCINAAASDVSGHVFMTDRAAHITNAVTSDQSGLRVESVPIDEIIGQYGITTVDLVKMNIEGGERSALLGMSATLPNVKNVAIGCHDFLTRWTGTTDCQTKAFVIETLQNAGFTVQDRPEDPRAWVRDTVYGCVIAAEKQS
jgi:FkbM family methyltransferase